MRTGSIGKIFSKQNIGKFLTKGVGVAALGCVAYDAHYIGKVQSDLYANERDVKGTAYYLNNTMYSTNMSKIEENIKDASYKYELDQGYKRFFNKGIGYIKGFSSMLVEHVIPFGLGLGALLGKGLGAKISAVSIAVYGAYIGIRSIFGCEVPKGPI